MLTGYSTNREDERWMRELIDFGRSISKDEPWTIWPLRSVVHRKINAEDIFGSRGHHDVLHPYGFIVCQVAVELFGWGWAVEMSSSECGETHRGHIGIEIPLDEVNPVLRLGQIIDVHL